MVLGVVVVLSLGCRGSAPPPNVILVSLDTLRADALGGFGYARDTSPNIDRFLSESVVFAQGRAPEPHTLPSHASLFTSLHPLSHGVEGRLSGGRALPAHLPTLASALREQGRATAAFVNGGFLHPRFGLGRGFQLYDYFSDIEAKQGSVKSRRGRSAAETNEAVFRWLDERGKAPFLLFVHYFDIHSDWELLPYDAPDEYRRMFLEGESAEAVWDEPASATEYLTAINEGKIEVTPRALERVRALYDAGVRYTDDRLGELFEGLRVRGLYDDAVIILVSDHGEEFLEHGKTQHTQLYEECLRVPIAFRFPPSAQVPVGVREDAVSILDVMPTVLDYLDVEPPDVMQGRSLVPVIFDRQPRASEPMVFVSSITGELGLYDRGWKLIYDPRRESVELYDLQRDALERKDLTRLEPARVESAMAKLESWYAERPKLWMDGEQIEVDLDPETIRQLQSLGYLH
jgi:arylsulfatase A-like enzyme